MVYFCTLFLFNFITISLAKNLKYSTLFGPSVPLNPTTTQALIEDTDLTMLVHLDDVARTPESCFQFCQAQVWCLAVDSCNYVTDLSMLQMDNALERNLLTHDSVINLAGLNFIVNQVNLVGNIDVATERFQAIDPKRITVLNSQLAKVTKSSHPISLFEEDFFTYYFTTHGPDRNALGADQSIRDGDLSGKMFKNLPVKAFIRDEIASTEPLKNQPFRPYYKNKITHVNQCNTMTNENLSEMIDISGLRSSQFFKIYTDENVQGATNERLKGGPHKFYLDCFPLDPNKEQTCYWKNATKFPIINTTFAVIDYHYAGIEPGFFGKTLLVYDKSKGREVGYLGLAGSGSSFNNFENGLSASHGGDNKKYNKFNFIDSHRFDDSSRGIRHDRFINFVTLCKKGVNNPGGAFSNIVQCVTNTRIDPESPVIFTETDFMVEVMSSVFPQNRELEFSSQFALNLIIEPIEDIDPFSTYFLTVNDKPIFCDSTSCRPVDQRTQIFQYEYNGVIHPNIGGGEVSHKAANSRIAIYEKNENNIYSRTGFLGVNSDGHLVHRNVSEALNDDYKWINAIQHFNVSTNKIEKIVFAQDEHVQTSSQILLQNTITPSHVESYKYLDTVYVLDENMKISTSTNHTDFVLSFDEFGVEVFDSFEFVDQYVVAFNNQRIVCVDLDTYTIVYDLTVSNVKTATLNYFIDNLGQLVNNAGSTIYNIPNTVSCGDIQKDNFKFLNIVDENYFIFFQTTNSTCDYYTLNYYNMTDDTYGVVIEDLEVGRPIHQKVSPSGHDFAISVENYDFENEIDIVLFNLTSYDSFVLFKSNKLISWDVDFDVREFVFLTNTTVVTKTINETHQTYSITPSLDVVDTMSLFESNKNIKIINNTVFAYYYNFTFFDNDGERYLEFSNSSTIDDFTTILDIVGNDVFLYNDVSFLHSSSFTHFDNQLLQASQIILKLAETGSVPKINPILLPTQNERFQWKTLQRNQDTVQCGNDEYVVSTQFGGDNQPFGARFSILCFKMNSTCTMDNTHTYFENVECGKDRFMVGIHRNSSLICKHITQPPDTGDTYPGIQNIVPFVGKIALHKPELDGRKSDDFTHPTAASFFLQSKAAPIHSLSFSHDFKTLEHFRYFNSTCTGFGDSTRKFSISEIEVPDETTDCGETPNMYITHVKCNEDECRQGFSALCVCASKCLIGDALPQTFKNQCPAGTVIKSVTCRVKDALPCGDFDLKCAPVTNTTDEKTTCAIDKHSHESDSSTIGIIITVALTTLVALVGFGFFCVCCFLPDQAGKSETGRVSTEANYDFDNYEENTFNFD